MRGGLFLRVTRSHTGRSADIDHDYRLAQEWASRSGRELTDHPAREQFVAALSIAPILQGDAILLLRARKHAPDIQSWENMGPPESHHVQSGGRYNRAGEVVLYLCDSEPGVLLEIARGEPCVYFVQEFLLTPASLRLADLASTANVNIVHSVLEFAESCAVPGRTGPETYEFSQYVAELVRSQGFDGMIVPGVLGGPRKEYRNVVIFSPEGRWRAWSRREVGFRGPVIASDEKPPGT